MKYIPHLPGSLTEGGVVLFPFKTGSWVQITWADGLVEVGQVTDIRPWDETARVAVVEVGGGEHRILYSTDVAEGNLKSIRVIKPPTI